MSRELGKCDKCGKEFNYYIIHNGFNESSYAYCNKCGKTAFFDTYKVPKEIQWFFIPHARHHTMPKELEKYIYPCDCGGSFIHDAVPRCPHCKKVLSANTAREYIEANAPGTEKGWHWQNNWTDTYAIVIEDNRINDNWKLFPPKLSLIEKIKSLFYKK